MAKTNILDVIKNAYSGAQRVLARPETQYALAQIGGAFGVKGSGVERLSQSLMETIGQEQAGKLIEAAQQLRSTAGISRVGVSPEQQLDIASLKEAKKKMILDAVLKEREAAHARKLAEEQFALQQREFEEVTKPNAAALRKYYEDLGLAQRLGAQFEGGAYGWYEIDETGKARFNPYPPYYQRDESTGGFNPFQVMKHKQNLLLQISSAARTDTINALKSRGIAFGDFLKELAREGVTKQKIDVAREYYNTWRSYMQYYLNTVFGDTMDEIEKQRILMNTDEVAAVFGDAVADIIRNEQAAQIPQSVLPEPQTGGRQTKEAPPAAAAKEKQQKKEEKPKPEKKKKTLEDVL